MCWETCNEIVTFKGKQTNRELICKLELSVWTEVLKTFACGITALMEAVGVVDYIAIQLVNWNLCK